MPKEKSKTELPKAAEGELQARLIKLREDAGFDLPQMAAGLCLSQEVIINLENESFDLLPEPPYVRGYLRTYAKLGDDDPSELINCYESLRGADADELNFQIKPSDAISGSSRRRLSPVWAQVIALGVLVGIITLISMIPAVNTWVSEQWKNVSSQLDPSGAENNPSLLGQLPVPSPLPDDEQNTSPPTTENTSIPDPQTDQITQDNLPVEQNTSENQNTSVPDNTENLANGSDNVNDTSGASAENTTPESIANTATENSTDPNTDNSNTENPASPEDIVSSNPDGLINIKLVFNNEVWLRIKDKENKTVFEGLNKAGTEKTIDLQKPLTFRVGNAQGLSLFIDNKPADISTYINGSIANFTLE